MPGISLQNVSKSYDGKTTSLYPSSLEIKEGEFIVLVGPSGCGKTTFLRLIAGLEDVSEGNILIDDRDVTWVEPKKRAVAMVFQNYALYPHLTVEENLMYPLKIMKMNKAVRNERVGEVSSMLSIQELLKRKPSQLSGGQKQRVAIGRALVRKPDIFLFDEPLSNLDARLREQMRIEIARLHQNLKRTTIYVTHDQHEAMTLGDRIVIMNGGNIVQVGTPKELYENPVNLFVAQFLGNPPMNLLKGNTDDTGFHVGSFLNIPVLEDLKLPQNEEVYLGVRPSNIQLSTDSEKKGTEIQGVIKLTEYLGDENHYRVQCGDEELTVVSRNTSMQIGEKCGLAMDLKTAFWFNQDGHRLEV